jgi:WD40 repeat protein
MSSTKPKHRVKISTILVYILFLITASIFLSSCVSMDQANEIIDTSSHTVTASPVNQATATRVATLTQTPDLLAEAIAEASTRQASYTATPIATPTPILPITSYDQLPGKLVSLNAENIDGIQLIGTFGEGLYYSTHVNEDQNRFVIVYSTGIDIFQKQNNAFQLVKKLLFDIYNHPDLFHNSSARDSIHRPYAVSSSTQYFAQNYGDRINVINLNNEQNIYIHLREGDNLGWKEFDQKIFFSNQSNYLLIDSLSEQILIDLTRFSELLRVEKHQGESFFSIDEDYILITEKSEDILEIYSLPDGRLINTITDFISDEFPLWATVTTDNQLITLSQSFIAIYDPFDQTPVIKSPLPTYYSQGRIEITSDSSLLIIAFRGDQSGVGIWDLAKNDWAVFFPGGGELYWRDQFLLSPNQDFAFICGSNNCELLSLPGLEKMFDIEGEYVRQVQFTKSNKYLAISRLYQKPIIFGLVNKKQLEIDIELGLNERGEQIDPDIPGKYFTGLSETNLWMSYYENQEHYLLKYELESGTQSVHRYTHHSPLFKDTEISVNLQTMKNVIDVRDLNDFSQLGRDLPSRSRYLGFETGVNSGIDKKNWFHGFQMDDEPFISSIRWKVDKNALKNAMNYILPQVAGQHWEPFIRNINSPDGRYRVELTRPGIFSGFKIYDSKSDDLIFSRENLVSIKNFKISNASERIYIVGLLYDGNGYMRVYNINTGELEKIFTVSKPPFNQNIGFPMDVSLDEKHLAMGNSEGLLEMVNLENDWQVLYTLDVLGPNSDIQFSPNGTFFAIASIDDKIQFYETETGKFLTEVKVLGGYRLGEYRLIQYYLTNNMILAARYSYRFSDVFYAWGWNGQIKVYGIFDWMK